ncbi:Sodium/myo-inositol cotransporter [Halocaridina rubra]|uniref:Sodium/myo-inositol cotransporter n=1 Tax=Halocaridina rubra TaxID=373956 RepID=A0AAN8X3D6_HALRR
MFADRGMISRVLFPNEVGCIDPEECLKFCGSSKSCSNSAYPKLVLEYLPSGMRGIMLSVMLAALMSNLTSIFNSASTLFTMDIWSYFRPRAKSKEQLLVGRQKEDSYLYTFKSFAAYLAPPIAAVYCMALLWKRMNEPAAFWGLMVGFLVGMVRMGLDFYYGEPTCLEVDVRPAIIAKIHYMYFAMLLFWLTLTIAFITSLITKPPEDWRLTRTTFFTRFDQSDRDDDLELEERLQNELLCSQKAGNEDKAAIPWYRQFYNYLCGFDNSAEAQGEAAVMNKHLRELSNLHQEKWEQYILNMMLFCIIVVALFLFIYFSINPFTKEEVQELQNNKLAALGYHNITL